uniref:Uncharacterized protein n=1 Tax=Phaeodactylum tricornutum TaxID=2850 RepID=A0A172E730_PHATR|nr:hypothetical protein [Phaeodactylum tricornutum]
MLSQKDGCFQAYFIIVKIFKHSYHLTYN